MFLPRLFSPFVALSCAYAQTQTSSTTNGIQLFIDNIDPNAGWVASVQNACNGSTTYALSCTSAPMNNACSPQTMTITEGADFYLVTTPAIYSETSATKTESCSLNTAESSAFCVATIVAGQYGNNIATTVSYNLTGSSYYQYNVAMTKGASHTAKGGSCLAHVNSATSAGLGSGMQGVVVLGTMLLTGVLGILSL